MPLQEVSKTAPLWWELQNIPTELVRELRRRSNTNNLGMNMPAPYWNATLDFQNRYTEYKGPLTPWVRVFSNGTGKPINSFVPASGYLQKYGQFKDYDGFILKGGDGFYDAFGYSEEDKNLSKNKAIIGYEANGEPHYIDSNFRYQTTYMTMGSNNYPQNNQTPSLLPTPGIVSVNVRQSKELLTFASFKFKCFGLAQLEYMTPFFLTPGLNVFIEFGWNLFNYESILNLNSPDECWKIIDNPQTAIDRSLKSNGNYGCISGIITNYNFSTTDGFVYDCNVEVTSRQGLYAGMLVDNNASTIEINNKNSEEEKTYVDFKTAIRMYLPVINDVLKQEKLDKNSNFLNYIINFANTIQAEYFKKNKEKKESDSNSEQLEKSKLENNKNINLTPTNITPIKNIDSKDFYNGLFEDRVFIGRFNNIYAALKKPTYIPPERGNFSNVGGGGLGGGVFFSKTPQPEEKKQTNRTSAIQYGKVGEYDKQISYASDIDFDEADGNDEVWFQLDFVFEFFNYLMSSQKQYKIKNTDIVINAHPNIISCDKNVLIPNPIAPKINIGSPGKDGRGGFLYEKAADLDENKFLTQSPDIMDMKSGNFPNNLKNAALRVRKVFKTKLTPRDNLDVIINHLYYKNQNHSLGSAAFPFEKNTGKYKPYYYGYLKNILISKSKLISLANDSNIKTYKQYLNAMLSVINESVGDLWKFSIDNGFDGTLAIVDKNTINYDELQQVYMFELGGTNNVIKSINFDVKLTNEQAVNVLFGGKNSSLAQQYIKNIQTAQASNDTDALKTTYNDFTRQPFLKFNDRMEKYQVEKFFKEALQNQPASSPVPGTPKNLENINNEIAYLQQYGKKNEVLCMTVKNLKGNDEENAPDDKKLNYKYLNFPSSMKGKLKSILDDKDYEDNNMLYSGIADNFQVEVVFDGIYGFRNLQVFAISNLPKPYVPGNIVFQILEVNHDLVAGKWETRVSALIRCVANNKLQYIKV